MTLKKINMNAFNEKLIHRYCIETLYDSNSKEKLLPERFKSKKIKLIVPEDTAYEGYRSDLTIYTDDLNEGIPVEVKFSIKDYTKINQIRHIIEKKGFVIAFDDYQEGFNITNENYIQIDYAHFSDWLMLNSTKLLRDSLNSKNISQGNKKYWLVILRGQIQNWKNMKKDYRGLNKNPFWAFQNDRKIINNMLKLNKDDEIIFLNIKIAHGNQSISDSDKKKSFEIEQFTKVSVLNPYFMILNNEKFASYFEAGVDNKKFKENKIISNRKYVHYFDFKIDDELEKNIDFNNSLRNELFDKIKNSANTKNSLVGLTNDEFEKLRSYCMSKRI